MVYRNTDYSHVEKQHETIRPLLAPVGSAIKQELPLPDRIMEIAETVLPIEEWKARYDPFNSDLITWRDPRPEYAQISLKQAFSTYFLMLRIYPDVVIKDRLDGANLIWDIRAKMDRRCPIDHNRDVSFRETRIEASGLIGKVYLEIQNLSSSLFKVSSSEDIIDVFIWKNGIYVYLLLVLILFLAETHNSKLLWAIGPSVAILMTYVLVIAWQMYFYIWFFPLSVVLLMIVAVIENQRDKENLFGSVKNFSHI